MNLSEERPVLVHWGPNSFKHLRVAKMSFSLSKSILYIYIYIFTHFLVQTSTLALSMHWILTKHRRCSMQNNQLRTRITLLSWRITLLFTQSFFLAFLVFENWKPTNWILSELFSHLFFETVQILLDTTSTMCALETGGGPWDDTWSGKAFMRQPLKALLQIPINPERLYNWAPGWKPPGYWRWPCLR